ncbi:MAG: hypothetical protein WBO46_18000 [Caldilineaceae bacterium]
MTTQREMEVEGEVMVVRIETKGNLHVRGKESNRVNVESNEPPRITREGDVIEVVCEDNCVVDVPHQAQVVIHTQGDLTLEGLAGSAQLVFVGGNASLSGVGEVRAQQLRGDLRVSQAAGVDVEEVRGNAHINDVGGAVSVNAKGDAHLHRANGTVSLNCKGNANLSAINGERVSVNAKGDINLVQCSGEIAVNAAGNINLREIVSQRVRAVAKGDIHVDFSEVVGGKAKVVTSGDLRIQNGETTLRRGKGIYNFRFGQGEAELAFVSKGDTHLLGVAVSEGDLRGISEDMGAWGEEFGAEMGEEMGSIGAELGAMGAELGREFGREFGAIGRDIARQVQDKVQRKLRAKMREMGKRTAKVEWGEGKRWDFDLGDVAVPPTPPMPPAPPASPAWNAPFDPVEEMTSNEPVSEEERALVLGMLEQGKISAAEAATLLEALGDGE